MTYIAPPFILGVAAVFAIYLASLGYFMNYLKNAHRETWLQLGSPSLILNNSISNGLLTVRFLFSDQHRAMNDPKLSKMVWAIRALFCLCLALLPITLWLGDK